MIKAAIFDFGGVVMSLRGPRSLALIAGEYGVTEEVVDNARGQLVADLSVGKISEEQFWQELSSRLSKPVPKNWREIWNKTLVSDALYPEIIELVRKLKVNKIKVVVLSNTIPPHARQIRDKGWYDGFDKMYLSFEIGLRKPDPKAYEYVLVDQGVRGDQCVFVDDLEENLVPARNLGMATVLAVSPAQVVKEVITFSQLPVR